MSNNKFLINNFGLLLQKYINDHHQSGDKQPIVAYCTTPDKLLCLRAACLANGISSYSVDNIRDFLKRLFDADPKGTLFRPDHNDSGPADNYRFKTKFKRPIKRLREKPKTQPVCKHDCNKLAYFGLPFCPWCMRQLPPFIPAHGNETDSQHYLGGSVTNNTTKPIMENNMNDKNKQRTDNNKEQMVTSVISGVECKFSPKDIVVDDGDVRVTYADVARIRKEIHKYIPK